MEKKVYEEPKVEKVEFDFNEVATSSYGPVDPKDVCAVSRTNYSWNGVCND